MKKVYFPQEDIVDVIIDDHNSPIYSAKHIGFSYERHDGKQMLEVYALVKDNNGEEKSVDIYHLFDDVQ